MNCLLESVAMVWINIVHTVNRKALEADLVTVAKEQLKDTISAMHEQIEKQDRELSGISTLVRRDRNILGKERLQALLLKSRRTRSNIATIHSKMTMLEGHLDAMECNEVNKTVLSTLQTSAKAMKKMGLGNDLRKTDDVINELERNLEHAHDINSTVSSSIVQMDSSVDDDTLEEELNLLLGIEEEPPKPLFPCPAKITQYDAQTAAMLPPSVTNKQANEDIKPGNVSTSDDKNDGPTAPPEQAVLVTNKKAKNRTTARPAFQPKEYTIHESEGMEEADKRVECEAV